MPDRNRQNRRHPEEQIPSPDNPPRWTTAGYWTGRREDEDQPWPGDREHARNYNREDMRRYNQRAVDQAERMRRLRGQGELDPRGQGQSRQENRPRGYSQGGPAYPAPRQRDPERSRSEPTYPQSDYGRDWDEFRPGPRRGQQPTGRRPSGQRPNGPLPVIRLPEADKLPGANRVDNFWGRREQPRQYRLRHRGEWWNNAGGREDLTSGRHYRNDLPQGVSQDWIEEPEYDLDPGYDYEFGRDFDFMDVPGPYAGVGPSGYHPSDERIRENICEVFNHNRQIDSSGFSVQVENGVVTLAGQVRRRAEKYLAEDIAASTPGVQNVQNDLRVRK